MVSALGLRLDQNRLSMLHFPVTFEVPHVGQLIPNPLGATHHSLAENLGLRLGGADSHPSPNTFHCKLPLCKVRVSDW